MLSINQMKKQIIGLQQEINKPAEPDNWKLINPHWKYDIMFCEWYLMESLQVDETADKYDCEFHYPPFNIDDLNNALNYFETNNIDPINENYLTNFIMFVCGNIPEYWQTGKTPQKFYDLWNDFIKTKDFSLFMEV